MDWWQSLSIFRQIVFVLGATATLLLVILFILMIIGIVDDASFDGDVDVDMDIDGINDEPTAALGGLRVFTLRGALAFFCLGGWTAFLLEPISLVLAIILGIVVGVASAVGIAFVFKQLYKLESQGNLDFNNAVGKHGVAYIRIPKSRNGKGKINITFQDRFTEIDAITDDEEDILTNKNVVVVGIENENTVIVTANKKE